MRNLCIRHKCVKRHTLIHDTYVFVCVTRQVRDSRQMCRLTHLKKSLGVNESHMSCVTHLSKSGENESRMCHMTYLNGTNGSNDTLMTDSNVSRDSMSHECVKWDTDDLFKCVTNLNGLRMCQRTIMNNTFEEVECVKWHTDDWFKFRCVTGLHESIKCQRTIMHVTFECFKRVKRHMWLIQSQMCQKTLLNKSKISNETFKWVMPHAPMRRVMHAVHTGRQRYAWSLVMHRIPCRFSLFCEQSLFAKEPLFAKRDCSQKSEKRLFAKEPLFAKRDCSQKSEKRLFAKEPPCAKRDTVSCASFFRKRSTICRALVRNMTYKDTASYASPPPYTSAL